MLVYIYPAFRSKAHIFGNSNRERFGVFLRTVLGFVLVYLSITSLKYISVGDATAIFLSAPVFTSLLARLFLNERFTPLNAALTLLSVVGVVLVARPPILFGSEEMYGPNKIFGAVQSFFAAISFAFCCIVMRKLKGTDPTVSQDWLDTFRLALVRFD
jgi:drug/metabolite transporter (DMT)-like permease